MDDSRKNIPLSHSRRQKHKNYRARAVPQNSLNTQMPGGLIKTITRFGGPGADHQRWTLCRTQVKHRNQDISSNITPGASRVFLVKSIKFCIQEVIKLSVYHTLSEHMHA